MNQYQEFVKLCTVANKKKFPLKCTFELTYKCNLKCCHCYVSGEEKRKELSLDLIVSIIDQLFEMGCRYIGFTGGEVFVRPDLWDILEHANKHNMKIDIKTNATFIDKKTAKRLSKIDLTMIEVSMYGVTDKAFDTVTGETGSFKAFMEGIHELNKNKIPLLFIYTPTKLNWREGRQVKEFVYDLGHKCKLNPYITPMPGNKKNNLKYRVEPEKMAKIMVEFNRRKNSGHLHVRQLFPKYEKDQFFVCNDIGKSVTVINPYGEMRPCIGIYNPSYDLTAIPARKAWKNIVDYIAGFKPGSNHKCPTCYLRDVCLQCPGYSILENGDMNTCNTYLHKAAKWIKEVIPMG